MQSTVRRLPRSENEHPAAEMRIEDAGLGIPRTERIVVVQVTTREVRFENRIAKSCFARNYFGAVGSRRRTSLSQLRKMLMKTGPWIRPSPVHHGRT